MPNLRAEKRELLALYPRAPEGLSLATPTNRADELDVVYMQHSVPDPEYRDWNLYRQAAWRSHVPAPPESEKFAHIYANNAHYMLHNNGMCPEDRLLLEADLRKVYGAPLSKVVAHLAWIERNPSPELKNIAAEFHARMADWLANRGYRFLTLVPISDSLTNYWERQGYVPIDEIGAEKVPLVVKDSDRVSGLHILRLCGPDEAYFPVK
ncbi:MAG: hypothetical protein HY365_01285 [Candidatus Aenigmarchaeota archaeon]|nr:hypothetical protein [Candidatus Aenigmarchaeota archaeon]